MHTVTVTHNAVDKTTFVCTWKDVTHTVFEAMTDEERIAHAERMARKNNSPVRVEVTRILATVVI
jgi:hypothetical protein